MPPDLDHLTRDEFVAFLVSNVPHLRRQTAGRLYDGGITTIGQIQSASLERLADTGVPRLRALGIRAFVDARRRVYRYAGGFSILPFEPSDLTYALPALGAAAASVVLCRWPAVLLGMLLTCFCISAAISGLYFVLIPISRRWAGLAANGLIIASLVSMAPMLALSLANRATVYRTSLLFTLSGLVCMAALAHIALLRYRTPINVRQRSVACFSGGLAIMCVVWGIDAMRLILPVLRSGGALDWLEVFALAWSLATAVFLWRIAYALYQSRPYPAKTTAIPLYGLTLGFGVLAALAIASHEFGSSRLLRVIARDATAALALGYCLWAYVLFPNRFFPRLGSTYMTVMIGSVFLTRLWTSTQSTGLPALLLESVRHDGVWEWLNRSASLLQIVSFLAFSGGLVHLVVRWFRSGVAPEVISENNVRDACEEELSWRDVGRYEQYFFASNTCFNCGFHQLGISISEQGLRTENLPSRGIALLWYQMGCGHALLNKGQQAIESLEKSFALWPSLAKNALHDEMLFAVRNEVRALLG